MITVNLSQTARSNCDSFAAAEVEMGRSACRLETKIPQNLSDSTMTAVVADMSELAVPTSVAAVLQSEAVQESSKKNRQVVSKAAIRRLAHDVGARLSKDAHVAAVVELESYVQRLLELAVSAMTFSRRKSMGVDHILYAAEAHGGVPLELRGIKNEDLKKLQRCNPQAPASLRKETLCHSEISEASFCKITKTIAKKCKEKLRLTSSARHFLQLLTEFHIMRSFDRHGLLSIAKDSRSATQRLFMEVYDCDAPTSMRLLTAFENLSDRIPSLLAMASVKTIDERLIVAALLPDEPWISEWVAPADASPPEDATKILGHLLRGRAPDKRITTGASHFLALALQKLQGLQKPSDEIEQQ